MPMEYNECNPARQRPDLKDENSLLRTLQASKLLFSDEVPRELQNIATKYILPDNTRDHLLTTQEKGKDQLITFVEERLVPCNHRQVHFRDTLHRNKYVTFLSLFDM